MSKRKLEELNLLDDFLFGTMVTYPEIGESFVREILKTIFQRNFGSLTVISQKVYYGSDTDKHGARLDVYIEEENPDDGAIVYDVDPENKTDQESLDALPFRVRFYHAKIDSKSLKSGQSYRFLKKVFVIMIMPKDPFGKNRMIYTIRNMCEEDPSMPYDDGARTIFLYTKGTEGKTPEELRQLLHYMEDTKEENAVNEKLRHMHEMVKKVKQDEEVSLEYMKIFEHEEMLIRQGRKEEQANTERERQRADDAEQRADDAERRADSAEQRADDAERRADKVEQENIRLREELEKLKKSSQ
ncbi:MAG: Rpn family recombination-promoting nuclease/putative transposase [Eubacteriales bacterium]|nr:Rpn family recombination-promoting nuclease/putative transposase [Eubacteriales bacterium]